MNVVLAFKWQHDPDDAFVSSDGTVKWRRGKLAASDDEAAAVECARKLAQATGGRLVAATIGNGDASWALARGAEGGVSIDGFEPEADEACTAEKLALAVQAAGEVDVVVMGDSQAAAGVAGVLAARLGMPLVAGAADFEADPESLGHVIVHRVAAGGIETLKVRIPAVIAVAAIDSEKNVPTMKQMLAARKLPVERPVVPGDGLRRSSVKVLSTRTPELRKAQVFGGEMPQAVGELVAQLRADGVL